MKFYKFKDQHDGNMTYILATSLKEASDALSKETNIPFDLVEEREFSEEDLAAILKVQKAVFLINKIVPF